MRIVNQCQSNFKYTLPTSGLLFSKSICSNTVFTTIVPTMLHIKKEVSSPAAGIYDFLTYCFSIKNITKEPVKHIFFSDNLSPYLKFVKNSFTYNGQTLFCLAPTKAFYIGDLAPGESVSLSFKALVLPGCLHTSLTSHACICFNYIYNIELDPTIVNLHSNAVSTSISHALFKQFHISHKLFLPSLKPHSLNDILYVCIQPTKTKIVSTPYTTSSNLLVYHLVVVGKMSYTFTQKKGCHPVSLQKTKIIEGFSAFLTVPFGIHLDDDYLPTLCIESIDYERFDASHLFVNTNILLEIK